MIPELTGLARILEDHSAEVTSYDGYYLEGCRCGKWDKPASADLDDMGAYAWDAFHHHQADMVREYIVEVLT